MSPPHGLSAEDIHAITEILSRHPCITRAILFGSRAKGTHRRGSDIDLALVGSPSQDLLAAIAGKLNEETLLPYFFDIVDYHDLTHIALKEHIDRVGVVLYERSPHASNS